MSIFLTECLALSPVAVTWFTIIQCWKKVRISWPMVRVLQPLAVTLKLALSFPPSSGLFTFQRLYPWGANSILDQIHLSEISLELWELQLLQHHGQKPSLRLQDSSGMNKLKINGSEQWLREPRRTLMKVFFFFHFLFTCKRQLPW